MHFPLSLVGSAAGDCTAGLSCGAWAPGFAGEMKDSTIATMTTRSTSASTTAAVIPAPLEFQARLIMFAMGAPYPLSVFTQAVLPDGMNTAAMPAAAA
ncbi:hypothetical protein M707_26650, partial [Arthrobacter sp. AK-YN10]